MEKESYKYKDIVERGFAALNSGDFDTFLSAADLSPNFTKYLGLQSMSVAPQPRDQWYEDLTLRFVGQNYKEWHASILQYWEDIERRSAIVWCTEHGVLVDGNKYEMDYIMRYAFGESGKLEKLFEYTDSALQKGIYARWMERQENKNAKVSERKDTQLNTLKSRHRRFYLLTEPRSCSNLLVRILALENQPNVAVRKNGQGYFFLPAVNLAGKLKVRGKHIEEWSQDERAQMAESYQTCCTELEKYVQAAEAEGKTVLIKEHCYFMTEPTTQTRYLFGNDSVTEPPWTAWTAQSTSTRGPGLMHSSPNNTILPDAFLETFLPIFLVRHPALAFPSHYRTIIDTEGAEAAKAEAPHSATMTLHWTRTLYDWYAQHLATLGNDAIWPLVLDADDVINSPDGIVQFCELVGLDVAKLRFEWTPASEEDLAQLRDDEQRRMQSTLSASAGVMKEKASGDVDISVEARKWKVEFGDTVAEKIEGWVRAAMPDYEFLKAKRLKPRAVVLS